jgi:hypothetical protein
MSKRKRDRKSPAGAWAPAGGDGAREAGRFSARRKDRRDHSLWGDGWAWSWFDAGDSTKTTSTAYKKDCLPCHVPAQATDWVCTSGYPTLK